ncbi:hypothetical protein SSU98_0999 [Streptococcus suis 98HAH33]|nr:hypothetical protein SSU98_0999 [Streptococcus suis 98HAH33]
MCLAQNKNGGKKMSEAIIAKKAELVNAVLSK